MKGQFLALNDNWLDTAHTAKTFSSTAGDSENNYQSNVATTNTKGFWINDYWYPYWTYSYQPKIQLTLTEVEHLRKLAKEDKRLKETLNKFTPWIQVVVDF